MKWVSRLEAADQDRLMRSPAKGAAPESIRRIDDGSGVAKSLVIP